MAAEGSIAALARAESRGKPGVFAHPALTPSEVSLPPDVEGKRRGDLLLVLGPLVVANAGSTAAGFRESSSTATEATPRILGRWIPSEPSGHVRCIGTAG